MVGTLLDTQETNWEMSFQMNTENLPDFATLKQQSTLGMSVYSNAVHASKSLEVHNSVLASEILYSLY